MGRAPRLLLLLVVGVLLQGVLGTALACHAAAAPEVPAAASVAAADHHLAECGPDEPCRHESPSPRVPADAVLRAPEGPRDGGLAAPTPCTGLAEREPAPPAAPTQPRAVPAAVLAPVAVLCVDRN